jgi:predicted DNA-binding protein
MPEELLQRLDKYSEKSRIPKTAITEMALEEYLDKVFLSKKTDKK